MYRKVDPTPNPPSNFDLPFEGQLADDNRWVIMAKLIPWSEFEAEYALNFSVDMGAPAKSFRMALGALIIKERLGTLRSRNRANKSEKTHTTILYRHDNL